jgi:Tol biopolymer transport system component
VIVPNKIFYTLLGDTNVDYRYMDPDGSNDQSLVTLPYNYDAIAGSPAENKYAFAYSTSANGATGYRIYTNTTVNIAGATQLSGTSFEYVGTIQYTPDGSKVIFTGSVNGVFGLYRINSDGTGQVRLDDGEEADISPDGTKIVYTRLQGSFGEIYTRTLSAGAGSGTRLTNNSFEDWYAQWSKDGASIIFSSNRDGNYEIYRMTAAGGSVTRLTNTPNNFELGSSYSPDSTMIAFVSIGGDDLNAYGVYRMNANGSGREILRPNTTNPGSSIYWTPGQTRSASGIGLAVRTRHRLRLP